MQVDTGLRERMIAAGIDVDRSVEILEAVNSGRAGNSPAVRAEGIPEIDGTTILDRRAPTSYSVGEEAYRGAMAEIAPEVPADRFGSREEGLRILQFEDLRTIGILLTPYLAYGVLNGGSATSYGDTKKNRAFDGPLFSLYEARFESIAERVRGIPKGIAPAFYQPDGSAGPAYLELKFRHLLLVAKRYRDTARALGLTPVEEPVSFFEMTSPSTESALRARYAEYGASPLLADLPGARQVLDTHHAVQPMLAALTHSDEGMPRRFFDRAWGNESTPLPLPGGHGQNFQVLAPVYRALRDRGIRFAYLGNVDNLGCTVDPVSLAILALSGADGAFDFAFRTPVDIKGGILVRDGRGRVNCADIGPAISKEEVLQAEATGRHILFNCATGLFSLDYLTDNLDTIVRDLPLRLSDQDKDAGRYSQAEQVTWEVIGMLDRFLIFAIDKYDRFLAAKMLMETLLTSGIELERARRYQSTATDLHNGLVRVLRRDYGLELQGGRWMPADVTGR